MSGILKLPNFLKYCKVEETRHTFLKFNVEFY